MAESLLALVALLVAAHLMSRVFESLRQPRVIGEIVGGLLLGPTLFAHFFPSEAGRLFPTTGPLPALLPIISQAGLVLLMYVSGAHLRSFVERSERKIVIILALSGIIVPFIAGLLIAPTFNISALIGQAKNDVAFSLVFAAAIAIASIPVISRIMLDLGIMETSFARIVVATAVIDDLVLYIVLAVALGLVQTHASSMYGLPSLLDLEAGSQWTRAYHVAAAIFVILLTLRVGPPMLRQAFRLRFAALRWDNAAAVQVFFLLVVTFMCIYLAVNPMFGALAAGMAAASINEQQQFGKSRILTWFGTRFFVPLYFALVGFELDLIRHFDMAYFIEFFAFACLVKAASVYAGARLAGETHSAATNFAAALNARGGPGIVLASVALDAAIINDVFFAILVMTAAVTSSLAGAWLGRAARHDFILRAPDSHRAKLTPLSPCVGGSLDRSGAD